VTWARTLLVIVALFSNPSFARVLGADPAGQPGHSRRGQALYEGLTGESVDSEKGQWDRLYHKNRGYVFGTKPAVTLERFWKQVPLGKVLDLGMGEGRHAVFMAKRGYEVIGIDISEVAVQKARRLAKASKVHIKTVVADLRRYRFETETSQGALLFYYFDPVVFKNAARALAPGGVVLIEGYGLGHTKYEKSFAVDTLLNLAQLEDIFSGFEVISSSETDDGKSVVSTFVARKRKASSFD
jgi:tellurite methyltransferase